MTTKTGFDMTVIDRIALLDVLPEQGDYLTLRIVRELREELSFTEEEHAICQFQTTPEGVTHMASGAEHLIKMFEPRKKTLEVIEQALKRADREKRLTPDHLHLYELFIDVEASGDAP